MKEKPEKIEYCIETTTQGKIITCPMSQGIDNWRTSLKTNEAGFCSGGRAMNPQTKTATKNVITNGGRHQLCSFNPWKWDF